jgi:hypothetical protein
VRPQPNVANLMMTFAVSEQITMSDHDSKVMLRSAQRVIVVVQE